jgi:hypothetical protein
MDDALISCAGTIAFFVLLFGFIALMRYLRYRETIALAERGLVRIDRNGGNGKDTLRWGIAITAVGLALSIGIYPLGFWIDSAANLPLRFGPWMLVGLIPMFFGLALVLIYVLTRKEPAREPDRPAEPPSQQSPDP